MHMQEAYAIQKYATVQVGQQYSRRKFHQAATPLGTEWSAGFSGSFPSPNDAMGWGGAPVGSPDQLANFHELAKQLAASFRQTVFVDQVRQTTVVLVRRAASDAFPLVAGQYYLQATIRIEERHAILPVLREHIMNNLVKVTATGILKALRNGR